MEKEFDGLMSEVDSKLTAAEKEALYKQFMEHQKKEKERIRGERAVYKGMVDERVKTLWPKLQYASDKLTEVKAEVCREMGALVAMKAELYGREEDQPTHSFTTSDGLFTIQIGQNVNDGWDDTVHTGEAKVKAYIEGLAKDDDSKFLMKALMQRLSKNKQGNLKASNVMQLKKLADERGDQVLIDAVQIVIDAYRPVLTAVFIRCEYRDNQMQKQMLPLSITEAPFLELDAKEDEPTAKEDNQQ